MESPLPLQLFSVLGSMLCLLHYSSMIWHKLLLYFRLNLLSFFPTKQMLSHLAYSDVYILFLNMAFLSYIDKTVTFFGWSNFSFIKRNGQSEILRTICYIKVVWPVGEYINTNAITSLDILYICWSSNDEHAGVTQWCKNFVESISKKERNVTCLLAYYLFIYITWRDYGYLMRDHYISWSIFKIIKGF